MIEIKVKRYRYVLIHQEHLRINFQIISRNDEINKNLCFYLNYEYKSMNIV